MICEPTPERVKSEGAEFDHEEQLVETTLKNLLSKFPHNTENHEVLAKVIVLNQLYSSRVLYKHVQPLAEHIVKSGIDALLQDGSPKAVEAICGCSKTKRYYSFATKYCSWHMPHLFPMWDSHVDEALWFYQTHYNFAAFKRGQLCVSYGVLLSVLAHFRHHFGLKCFDFKDIDKFLWRMGFELLNPRDGLIGAGRLKPHQLGNRKE